MVSGSFLLGKTPDSRVRIADSRGSRRKSWRLPVAQNLVQSLMESFNWQKARERPPTKAVAGLLAIAQRALGFLRVLSTDLQGRERFRSQARSRSVQSSSARTAGSPPVARDDPTGRIGFLTGDRGHLWFDRFRNGHNQPVCDDLLSTAWQLSYTRMEHIPKILEV